jgi:hypothetical protein
MKNKILILLLIAILINTHLMGCRRDTVKPDAPQDESLSTVALAQEEIKKTQEIIRRDGHYIEYANGVVYDENMSLEWYVGPDKNTDFITARSWVENLTVAGGNWRMPTRSELMALYKEGAGAANMTPLLKTTGMWVWSGEVKDYSAWTFNFGYGYGHWDFRSNSNYFRGFAVRYR